VEIKLLNKVSSGWECSILKMTSFLIRKPFFGFLTVISMPLLLGIAAVIFERCFTSRSVLYCDDPEYKEYVYDLPKQIWFHDAQGSVDLLGCKPDRSMKTM